MKSKILIFNLLVFFTISNIHGQNNIRLQFNKTGNFKIAQFTDLHWSNESSKCAETTAVINHVLASEKPDLAILTGDVVTAPPAREGWLAIARIFENAKTPWAAVLGNHDTEAGISGEEIFQLLEGLPYFVGEKGPAISGDGNYTLPLLNIEGTSVSAVLYCFDSHNKPEMYKYGHYNWIQFDQIEWYRKVSGKYSSNNGNKPLPSLAFFHIPILEYKNISDRESTVGNKFEGVASPEINSGIFASFIEMKDVMGVFTGHDHNNDYIGIEQDIALAFGRTTGADAYGKLKRGARIIELYQDKFQFDTWIRTIDGIELSYYFPSGISSEDEKSLPFISAPSNLKKGKQGLSYSYFEGGTLKKTADIKTNAIKKDEGFVNNFTLQPAMAQDSFAFVFKGIIEIPNRGVYNFYTFSDDGSVLKIDGHLVVDNDGSHSLRRKDGKIALEAGLHEIEVIYFENYMGEFLEVGWSSRSFREETIPDRVLFQFQKR